MAKTKSRRRNSPTAHKSRRVVAREEFRGQNTVALARSLLGKVLVRSGADGRIEGIITEVEAYHTAADLACHASKGRTKRTELLFGPAGIWYVYLCYGIHEMLNLVTGPAKHPAAILIRGIQGVSGPGRVTRHLSVDRRLNGAPARPESGLHVEDWGLVIPRGRIVAGPRVGIDYAGPVWAAKPWRFRVADDIFGSADQRPDGSDGSPPVGLARRAETDTGS